MAREWATDVSDGTGATTAQSDHPCHSPRPAMRWSRIGNIAARLALSTWAHHHPRTSRISLYLNAFKHFHANFYSLFYSQLPPLKL